MSTDIYFENAFRGRQGTIVHRVGHVCVAYGISAAVVQTGERPADNKVPEEWEYCPPSLHHIVVEDEGEEHMDAPGVPAPLPNADLLPDDDDPVAFYLINEELQSAKPLPWHHRVTIKRSDPKATLHYHQHAERTRHDVIPPILPETEGSSREFHTLMLGTQVQSYRHTLGVIQCVSRAKPQRG